MASKRKHISDGLLATKRWPKQALGAAIKNGRWIITVFCVLILVIAILSGWNWNNCDWINSCGFLKSVRDIVSIVIRNSWFWLFVLLIAVLHIIIICNTLISIYRLQRNEIGITRCHIIILISIGLFIIGSVFILHIQDDPKTGILLGIIGAILTWVFQDKIIGAMAFVHLRMHHLLNIGDWIKVPKYDVDGEVKSVSLTTVTVYNWDTTTSTVPISELHSGHFINYQPMSEGKTYGRRMLKSFILDTRSFHAFSKEEADQLNSLLDSKGYHSCLPQGELHEGAFNAYVYRLYLYLWLMNQDHVSQQPRLIVRWMDQEKEGMPLQLYTYIISSGLAEFECYQSRIIEHVIESTRWFGLRLYQSPSGKDFDHTDVRIIHNPNE